MLVYEVDRAISEIPKYALAAQYAAAASEQGFHAVQRVDMEHEAAVFLGPNPQGTEDVQVRYQRQIAAL